MKNSGLIDIKGRRRQPTIKDIAREVGVSVATVSNVLRGKAGEASKETADRIHRKVQELGYVKNLTASSLSGDASHLLAVVFPGIYLSDAWHESPDVNPFYGDFIVSLEKEAAALGYDLLISSDRQDRPAPIQFQRNVDALIIVGNSSSPSVLQKLHNRIILVDSMQRVGHVMSVRTNEVRGAELSAGHLISKGRRKLAYIGYKVFDFPPNITSMRYDGAKRVCDDAGVVLEVIEQWTTFRGGEDAAAEVVNRGIDGVITAADVVAAGLIRGLTNLNRTVPYDVAVMGYDNLPISQMVRPMLSTIDQCLPEKARSVMELVKSGQPGDERVIEPRLILRNSA